MSLHLLPDLIARINAIGFNVSISSQTCGYISIYVFSRHKGQEGVIVCDFSTLDSNFDYRVKMIIKHGLFGRKENEIT